jgi:hypothetical protein
MVQHSDVTINGQDFQQLISELHTLLKLLDEVGRYRAQVAMMLMRLDASKSRDPDKTPIRSVSADSWQAFKTSSEFENK